MASLVIFLLALFVFAAFLRDEAVFTILYIFIGLYLVGRWWGGQSLNSILIERIYTRRAFLGDEITVRLQIRNKGILPVVWLRVQDALPVELSVAGSFKRVLTLGPFGSSFFEYTIQTRKRGFYQVGPFRAWSGDLFGLAAEQSAGGIPESLTVYPRIYQLPGFSLTSRSPMGTLRTMQPIFEDPTRIRSKRDYVSGDSLRRVDWKASANLRRLVVKQYEPAISLQTMILLNLGQEDYDMHTFYDSFELGIVMAASVANWVMTNKQSVGLATNGVDPMSLQDDVAQRFHTLPARKGQVHLIRLLDILARVIAPAKPALPFLDLLRREIVHLPWGSTLVVITPRVDEGLFDCLFQARRAGLLPKLVLVGKSAQSQEARQKAEIFHFPFQHVLSEGDLAKGEVK